MQQNSQTHNGNPAPKQRRSWKQGEAAAEVLVGKQLSIWDGVANDHETLVPRQLPTAALRVIYENICFLERKMETKLVKLDLGSGFKKKQNLENFNHSSVHKGWYLNSYYLPSAVNRKPKGPHRPRMLGRDKENLIWTALMCPLPKLHRIPDQTRP